MRIPLPRRTGLLAWTPARGLTVGLLAVSAILFALHFLHLDADFPNHSPWTDWSKYTDEGWYGDAAIRHYLTGHWYWKGDFNPAVALPVWPALELLVFRFTGVSPAAARALTLCVFGLTLATFYALLRHFGPRTPSGESESLAAPLTVLFLCASPFLYVFERMAILEPLLVALTALGLLTAFHLRPLSLANARSQGVPGLLRRLWPSFALGLLLPAMVLTKTTAIALIPAVAYMVWARAGYRLRPFFRLGLPPAALGLLLWAAYFFGFVRPRYLEDYRYLFSANAYTGIGLQPLYTVVLNTLSDGAWMGHVLYPAFFVVLALAIFWRPALFSSPLFSSLLLWIAGYFAFLAYHNNLQPRYYLVVAVPITAVVALGLDDFRRLPGRPRATVLASVLAAAVALAIVTPDAVQQFDYILHPEYTFQAAARGIARIVRADKDHSPLVLSISGSDLTLMTGLPSIDDDFGTLDLDKRVAEYRPGWYASWNELDDDKADAITPLFHAVRVAAFPAMDDPDRNLLILYRLDPGESSGPLRRRKRRTPKPLVTNLGQQPTTTQLQH